MTNKVEYWENIVEKYQCETQISCDDFHYGPLIPGDKQLKLLPEKLEGLNCLEIACGGAQNSIYLAKNGAECTAFDSSAGQISYAEKLAKESSVTIDFKTMSMDNINLPLRSFDLIHSAYGLNFASDLNNIIASASSLLKKNGVLLFSMPHPLFSGEFLELDHDYGLFIMQYFEILPELRFNHEGNETTFSNFYSLDKISSALSENALLIERICEPEVCDNPPYTSELWEEYRPQMQCFPGTIIIKAVKK